MQFLNHFFDTSPKTSLITRAQGSAFAKDVANDFNPIHDEDSKRFCVPGDLLFAIALHKYGLYQNMSFEFLDMVKANSPLVYPEQLNDGIARIYYADSTSDSSDKSPKEALAITASGESMDHPDSVENVLRKYVAFSGQNFPYILMPLMEQHGVMINPARPLIIYQSMEFELTTLNFAKLEIKLESTHLDVNGKRGDAMLNFCFYDGGNEIGRGAKKLVLSGLRPYEASVMQALCDEYLSNAKKVSG